MDFLVKLLSYIILKLLRGYQLFLSPILAGHCRYQPTCSQYAVEAIEVHGLFKGIWLGSKRLFRCNPFGGSVGFDPVPRCHQDEHRDIPKTVTNCIASRSIRSYIPGSDPSSHPGK